METDFPIAVPVDNSQSSTAPIEIPDNAPAVNLTPPQIQSRAEQATLALKPFGKTYQEVSDAISQGKEASLRQEAALLIQGENERKRQRFLMNVAKFKQGPITPDEQTKLLTTLEKYQNIPNPDSVIEEQFGKEIINVLNTSLLEQQSSVSNALIDIPNEARKLQGMAGDLASKTAYISNKKQEVANAFASQSYLGIGVDFAKFLVPLYGDIKLRGLVEEVSKTEGGLLGTNLEAQAQFLLRQPVDQMISKTNKIVNRLIQDNPQAALIFINALEGQSTSDYFWNNMSTPIDILSIPGGKMAAALTKKALSWNELRIATRDVLKAAEAGKISTADLAAATGNVSEAATQTATNRLQLRLAGKADPTKEAVESLPTAFRTDLEAIKNNPGRLTTDAINKLEQKFEYSMDRITNTISNVMRVQRIPAVLAQENVIRAIVDNFKNEYKGASILDSSLEYNKATNTFHLYADIGTPGGSELFESMERANKYAKRYLKLAEPHVIEQQGGGFFIRVQKPLNETQDIIRDALLKTKEAVSPEHSWLGTFVNGFVGKYRTPEETLSLDNRINRKLAVYASNEFLKVAKDMMKDVQDLKKGFELPSWLGGYKTFNRERWYEWERILKKARDDIDPKTKERGYFAQTPVELDGFYQQLFKRLPTEQETMAYFAYKNIIEYDRVLRNINVYRNKARLGSEQFQTYVLNPSKKKVLSGFFDGVARKDVPSATEDTILFLGSRQGEEKLLPQGMASLNTKRAGEIRQLVKEGKLKVIEIYDPEMRHLAPFLESIGMKNSNARIRYLITPNHESKPLSFDQVPRRGGGHFEYDYDWYIKQAKVRPEKIANSQFRHWYEGDTTILGVLVRAEGEEFAQHLDRVRQLLRVKDLKGAKAYADANLPINWKQLYGWFRETKTATGEKVPAMLSLAEPIVVVKNGTQIGDVSKALEARYANLRDGTKSGSLARVNQVQYTGARDAQDLHQISNLGSKYNPLWAHEPAKFVDPIPTMDRALTRIINSTYLDDYKIFSAEHWLREAATFLKPREDELRFAPMFHFHNPDWKDGAEKMNPEKVVMLKAQHMQMQQLWGIPSETERVLHSFASKLHDSIYEKVGGKVHKLGPLAPTNVLPKLKDPFEFMRGVTFHFKLGLFNLPQLLTQLQTYVTILGVAGPQYAVPGAKATLLHSWALINHNPEILNHLDKLMTKQLVPGTARWKPGEFKEAFELLKSTGFGTVAGEYAVRDAQLTPQLAKNAGTNILDWGQKPFQMGEKLVREAAWYTAYKEFRDKVPNGRLTELDIRKILDRADTLNVNMSRASSSLLHTGIMSLPSQFLTYQIRAFELFTGKRLTPGEKARLFGTYMTVYGLPGAAGVWGFPAGDYIRKHVIENGYVVGDNWIESTIMEGVPSMIGALITGAGDYRKGNYYNVYDRWSPQGFEFIREALRGDRTFWDIIGGAAFSTFSGIWSAKDPFIASMMSAIRDDDKAFPLKVDDFVSVFKEISSVNNTWKLIAALNTGKWLSKKGTHLTDVDMKNAIFMYLSGLQPQDVSDVQLKTWGLKDLKELQKHSQQQFNIEIQKALQSAVDGNYEQSRKYWIRGLTYLRIGGWPEEKMHEAIRFATQDKGDLVSRIDWEYYMKHLGRDQFKIKSDALKRTLRVKEERK